MSYQAELDPIDEQIFQAAEHLLTEVGDSFTMAQLTDKANVSRATIYRRVGNKESLLTHLAEVRGADITTLPDIRTRILLG
ncbi:MAG: helix-turn-helix transcriptional regulator, partial [Anaerolineales bacterium]|nr:helix-turn-helix transcriptional regulator [Anaerolineales bacterium]